jgi:hypothetical protein
MEMDVEMMRPHMTKGGGQIVMPMTTVISEPRIMVT